MPPHANAKIACTIWKPLPVGSAHGLRQIATRSRTCANCVHERYEPIANSTPPSPRYSARSVATQSITTNSAKKSSDEPRSRSATITTSETPHATTTGPR